MGVREDAKKDEVCQKYLEICVDLNMDKVAANEAWSNYKLIRQNYSLEVSFPSFRNIMMYVHVSTTYHPVYIQTNCHLTIWIPLRQRQSRYRNHVFPPFLCRCQYLHDKKCNYLKNFTAQFKQWLSSWSAVNTLLVIVAIVNVLPSFYFTIVLPALRQKASAVLLPGFYVIAASIVYQLT